jgi:hypothetical protein
MCSKAMILLCGELGLLVPDGMDVCGARAKRGRKSRNTSQKRWEEGKS